MTQITQEAIEALETARAQILEAYRVWEADDVTALPPPNSKVGKAIAKIDAALTSSPGKDGGQEVEAVAFHVRIKGYVEELCFTEDGAQSLIKRLRRTKGQDGEATITPLYATTPKCSVCGDSGVEEVYGGHGTVMELPCSICTAAPSAPEGWQPIETAPRDGTVIMAWHTIHNCPMAIVWKEQGHPFSGEVLNWYEKSYTTAWPERCFSHWQPLLPAPPALGGASHE